jgi:zinc transport system substrate-binding protein
MKKNIMILGVITLCLITFALLYRNNNQSLTKPQIISTIYPWHDAAEHITQGIAESGVIVPAGVEPHEYEPSALDVIKATQADLFIYNGGAIDTWAEKIAAERMQKGRRSFRAMDYVSKTKDPHIWLNPAFFLNVSRALGNTITILYPKQYNSILTNETNYFSRIEKLDSEYHLKLQSCTQNTIAVSHDAFRHMAQQYHFETVALSGISPEEEPSIKRLREVSKIVQEKKIRYIFFETLVSPKLANSIAAESNAVTLVLNPLEGLTSQQLKEGASYESVMKDNLKQLQIALECN